MAAETCAAIVAHVWNERCVNLAVFDANGVPHSRTSVPLVQPEDERPEGMCCEWMPYQKGQAAKTEALERQAGQVEASEPQAEKTALELGAAARAAGPEASYER